VKERLKALLFGLLRKDPEAVVVSFVTGDDDLARAMIAEIRTLVPGRRHVVVAVGHAPSTEGTTPVNLEPGNWWSLYRQLRREFRALRIGLAPVLFTAEAHPLRLAAWCLAPRKILAYNQRLERHHLRARTFLASLLFLRGVPVDRIYLRPRWLCPWKRDRSIYPEESRIVEGRPLSRERRRVAILSPYFPYPLSHGGAVRIFHLLRETAREFDLFLFAFSESEAEEELASVLEHCARIVLVRKPRYREPRWSTLLPPEVHEFDSPTMRRLWSQARREYRIDVKQVEYTHLARYGGDILVEHDVTFDLFRQVLRRQRSLTALWDFLRWRRFELMMLPRFRRVVAMSQKDMLLLGSGRSLRIMENGVDTERFHPAPEQPGQRLLFIGSFRHFPNILAFRFFIESVWPRLRDRFPEMTVTVVCGPDHLIHWTHFTGLRALPSHDRIRLTGFVSDVRPLYAEANLVIVPTTVSAGTNVKVLEAMAMGRAVVSTSSGCAGLGLEHKLTAWIADGKEEFAQGIVWLIEHPEERARIAAAARVLAERRFDWKVVGEEQRKLYRELCDLTRVKVRRGSH
jgi:glycosyltransferase involved in cell wall biosynthesis